MERLVNIAAENAIVGAVLLSLDNQAVNVARDAGLRPESFTDPRLSDIFRAAETLAGKGETVDAVSVQAELRRNGTLDRVNEGGYLSGLCEAAPAVCNAATYARQVADAAKARGLHVAAVRAAERLRSGEPASDVCAYLSSALDDCADDRRDDTTGSVGELLKRDVGCGKVDSIPWGYGILDRRIGGIPEASLIVIGAYPSTGKTALTVNILSRLASNGIPCALLSLEMSAGQIIQTIIARESSISASHLRAAGVGGLPAEAMRAIGRAVPQIVEWPLHIIAGDMDAASACAKARLLQRKRGVRVVAVDYLQRLRRNPGEESRRLGIDQAVNAFKSLAVETGLSVIVLSQLARSKEHGAKSELLKESGGILEAADLVVTLERPRFKEFIPCPVCGEYGRSGCAECNGSGQVSSDDEIILDIEKNRLGDVGRVRLGWEGKTMKVSELARSE